MTNKERIEEIRNRWTVLSSGAAKDISILLSHIDSLEKKLGDAGLLTTYFMDCGALTCSDCYDRGEKFLKSIEDKQDEHS